MPGVADVRRLFWGATGQDCGQVSSDPCPQLHVGPRGLLPSGLHTHCHAMRPRRPPRYRGPRSALQMGSMRVHVEKGSCVAGGEGKHCTSGSIDRVLSAVFPPASGLPGHLRRAVARWLVQTQLDGSPKSLYVPLDPPCVGMMSDAGRCSHHRAPPLSTEAASPASHLSVYLYDPICRQPDGASVGLVACSAAAEQPLLQCCGARCPGTAPALRRVVQPPPQQHQAGHAGGRRDAVPGALQRLGQGGRAAGSGACCCTACSHRSSSCLQQPCSQQRLTAAAAAATVAPAVARRHGRPRRAAAGPAGGLAGRDTRAQAAATGGGGDPAVTRAGAHHQQDGPGLQ